MSRHAKAMLRNRTVEVRPVAAYGGVVLELLQDSRRNCKSDAFVSMSLDEARLFLRTLQGAVDEAFRREKEAFKTAARELQP